MDRGPIGGVDYARTVLEFQDWFATEAACLEFLTRLRWPDGFVCPKCDASGQAWRIAGGLWMCRPCGRQTSVTTGTIFDRTRSPLRMWFHEACYVTQKRTKYAALFAAVGGAWGAGDGSTTFALPNTLNKVARGASAPGGYADRTEVTIGLNQTPPHSRSIAGDGGNRIVVTATGSQQNNLTGPATPGVTFSHLDGADRNGFGGVDPFPTLPAYVGMPRTTKAF